MALRSDTEGFLIGDPLDMGAALDLWRDVRDDTRAILGMLRKRQGGAEPAPDIRGREVGREAVVPGRRADRPAAPIRSVEAPVSRPGRAESSRETASPAETPRRALGAGAETRQTNALLGRLIRRFDGHDQRLTKSLKAIERAIEDLAEVSRQSGARAAAGGSGGGLPGWAAGAGAAIAGWLGLKKGGGLIKSLTGGARNLLGRMPVGRMGGPLGAILGGAGLMSAWSNANADTSLTDRQRATKKGRAVGEFGGLMGGMAAGAASGSVLGPVGTIIGGLIGGALGAWGGGAAGEAITEQAVDFADTETGMQIAQQWTSTTATLRGRWDTLMTRGTETFSGMGAKWDSAVEKIQGWFSEASGALSRFAEQANTWVKDATGIDVKAEAQNAADAIAGSAARANAWVEDKTGVDVGDSVKRGVDATTDAVRSGFDRLINLIRPSAAGGDGESASVAIDDAKLTADLGSGGALRHAATASTTAGAMSDVPTLSQATEASALASGGSSPGTGLVATTSVGHGEKALLERIAHGEGTSDVKARAHGFESGYDVSYGLGKYSPKGGKKLSEMTLGEVKQYQEQMLANQRGNKLQSTAVGKYQFIRKTLNATQKKLGLSDDTVFSPEVQDQMGMELLKTRGYDQWKAGKKSDQAFQKSLAQEWASIADPDTGRSYHGQHVGTTDAEIKQAMAAAKSGVTTSGTGAQASADQATQSVVRRINQGATRNKDITPELEARVHEAVRAVYGDGARADLYSGGQDKEGPGARRTGSTRHDDGKAGDFYIYGADGKQIKGDELGKLGQYWTAKNYGGVGMEMKGGGVHLDEHTDRAKAWGYADKGGRYTKAQREAIARGIQGELPDLKLDPAIAALPGKATSVATARPDQAVAATATPNEKATAVSRTESQQPAIQSVMDPWRQETGSPIRFDRMRAQSGIGLPRRDLPGFERAGLTGVVAGLLADPLRQAGGSALDALHQRTAGLIQSPSIGGALSVVPPIPSLPAAMPIPSPAAAPSIQEPATSPRGQGAGERKDDNRPMRNVGQDVRDRRIAHIVTGGIGAAL